MCRFILVRIVTPVIVSLALASPVVCVEKSSSRQAQTPSKGHRLKPIDHVGLEKLLKAQRGSVVILNFWATWCDPCREEFPELLRVYEDYRQNGVVVIFLSLDQLDHLEEVEHFLEERRVAFTSYIRSEEDVESIVTLVDPDWVGALPSTFLFDRHGKRVETLLGGKDYETFVRFVEPLL